MHTYQKTLLTMFSVSLLFGCSVLEDDDDSVAKVDISGKVADGYLAGAKVCLDLNSNKVCDEGEPSTTSTTGGGFSLEGVTQAQLDSSPLLVEIIVGETIDEDNPGETIDKKYTLTAPAGYSFISPLTTMVQSEIEDNGISAEEAKGSIQAKLGTTLDLEADYVAGSDGGADAAEFERLHKVAQVTVVVLQNNIALVEEVLAGADISFEDLLGLIVEQVLESLAVIAEQVDAAGEIFDPTTVAESDALDAAEVDTATLEEDLAEREAAREIETANIAAILGNGDSIHIFDAHRESAVSFGYESITKTDATSISFLFTHYDPNTNTWLEETDEPNDDGRNEKMCILNNSTWDCRSEDKSEKVTLEGASVIVQIGDIESSRTEITGVSVDLADKRILTFLEDDYYKVIDPMSLFSTGATGYKLSFKRSQNMHVLFNADVAAITDCWQNHESPDEEENSQTIAAGQPYSPTDTWCNNVFIRTGDGDYQTDGAPATSFADITSATAVVNPEGVDHIKGTPVYGRDFEIMAEFVSGGVVNYYSVKHHHDQAPTIEDKVVGSWEEKTVDGKVLFTYMLPPVFAEQGDFEADERAQFFTVEGGVLRRGGIAPAGDDGDSEWVFNDAARDQIKTAFHYDLLQDLALCETGDVDFDPDNLAEAPGASAAEFVTAASNCSDVDLVASELENTTLVTDFGFLNFKPAGAGVFLGEVGENEHAVLDFTWAINSNGHVIVNAQETNAAGTIFLRLTVAKIAENSRQISVKTFGQEAPTAAELDTVKGNIFGELWGIN